jgi:Fe-S-cluster formation regulator IscX/YfhJ
MQWEPSCSLRTDRQTDMKKLIVAFRNFADAPKNSSVLMCIVWISEETAVIIQH